MAAYYQDQQPLMNSGGYGYQQPGYPQDAYGYQQQQQQQPGYSQDAYNYQHPPQQGYPGQNPYANNQSGYNTGMQGQPPPGPFQNTAGPSQNVMTLCWFAAACCISAGAFIGIFATLFSGQFADALEMLYLFFIGCIMAVLDCPIPVIANGFQNFKWAVDRYAVLFVRYTGKGLVLIFLASALFASMWVNMTAPFFRFLAVVFNLFAACIGIAAFAIGFQKSQTLDKAKDELRRQGVLNQNYPDDKIFTPQEFEQLTRNYGGYQWEDRDLRLIMQALSTRPSWLVKAQRGGGPPMQPQESLVTVSDLRRWSQGNMILL